MDNEPMQVEFLAEAVVQAVEYGQQRTNASLKRRDNWGLKNNDPVEDARRQTIGTLGEWAVAHSFEQDYVFTINTFKAPDVVVNGIGLQVKASERAANLIIRPDAKDHEPYILCHVIMPPGDPRNWTEERLGMHPCVFVDIIGWLYPYDARLIADAYPEYHRDPGHRSPAIFMPRELLRGMSELEEVCRKGVQ